MNNLSRSHIYHQERRSNILCGKISVTGVTSPPRRFYFLIYTDDDVGRKARRETAATTWALYSAVDIFSTLSMGLDSALGSRSRRELGKISEMWPFARASLRLTLSFSSRRPNTRESPRARFLTPAHAHGEIDEAVTLVARDCLLSLISSPLLSSPPPPLSSSHPFSFSWMSTSYNRHPGRSVSNSSRPWKLTSASIGAASIIDLDRSAIKQTSQSSERPMFSPRENFCGFSSVVEN